MLPPPSVFGDDQNLPTTLSWRRVLHVVRSNEFIAISIGTFMITLSVALTLFVSYSFFSYLISAVSASVCFLIFSTFVFSQGAYLDGFFMIVGNGYLFVAVLTLLSKGVSLSLVPLADGLEKGGVATQIESLTRLVEVICFALGLGLAHRSFKGGWKLLVFTILGFLIFVALVLCSIFWWKLFPTVAILNVAENGDRVYKATLFRSISASLWPFYFWAFIGILIWRRRHFSESVFVFLLFALSLRSINLVLNAMLREMAQNPLDVAQLISRLASQLFLYFSVGTSVLRDPIKTLFYSLNLKQAALQNQNSVISWMIDQVPTVCILLDESGIVQHVNKFGTQKLKCSPRAPLILGPFFDFLNFETDAKRANVLQQMRDLIRERCPNNYVVFTSQSTKVDSNRIIEWTLKLVKSTMPIQSSTSTSAASSDIEAGTQKSSLSNSSDSMVSVLCLGRDITDEMEREELLLEARNNAEKLALMQENFVANTSHELRTPLNCIVGVSDLLLLQNNNESDGEMVTMIRTSANSLLALINDLLEFAKLKQGQTKLTYAPMRLRSFVENVVMSMSVLYERGGIDFCYSIARECPDHFDNDENRLRQILFNLLSNSVKFTQKGQIQLNVSVSTMSLSRGTNALPFLKFTVKDSGIGINHEDMKNLFTRFFQVDRNKSQKSAGTGIGLSISKQLVELMGGTISVESTVGKGTTFTFRIPLEQQQHSRRDLKVDSYPRKESMDLALFDSTCSYSSPDHRVIVFLKNEVIGETISRIMANEYDFKCVRYTEALQVNSTLNHFLEIVEKNSESNQSIDQEKRNEIVKIAARGDEEENVLEEEEDLMHDKISRISILLETKHLVQLDLALLSRLKEKGVEIQIIMALAHSASCQAEMESPHYRDFQLNLVRKPFNTSKIADTLRVRNAAERKIDENNAFSFTMEDLGSNAIEMAVIHSDKISKKSSSKKSSKENSPPTTKRSKEDKKDDFPLINIETLEKSTFSFNANPSFVATITPTFAAPPSFSASTSSSPSFSASSFSAAPPSFSASAVSKEPLFNSTPPSVQIEENPNNAGERPLRILIVEDDKTNQKVLQLMLKRIKGVEYDIADDGKMGVEFFMQSREKKQLYDCIFMDSQMPIMCGSQATAEIRRVEEEFNECGRTYVTALTANALMDEKSQLFRTLVDDYLTKPITFKTFSEKIEWLRQSNCK